MERWRMRDPFEVYARLEEQEHRQHARSAKGRAERARQGIEQLFKETPMTQTQSDEIESLLQEWYRWQRAQRELLGYSRVSPMFRDADSSDVHDTGEDADARIHACTSASVDFCISKLDIYQSAAIQVHCRNAHAGNSVHRNPRIGTPENHHAKYAEAKAALCPILVREGLVKRA